MKNFEKYKTAEARAGAYNKYCNSKECSECQLNKLNKPYGVDCCMAFWLELEAEEEKPLPCPFCGGEVVVGYTTNIHKEDYRQVWCKDIEMCGYYCEKRKSADDAIAAHNRVAKAVMESKKEVE